MEEVEFANMTLELRWKNAANLKNLGVDIAIIAQATGLTVEQVETLGALDAQ